MISSVSSVISVALHYSSLRLCISAFVFNLLLFETSNLMFDIRLYADTIHVEETRMIRITHKIIGSVPRLRRV